MEMAGRNRTCLHVSSVTLSFLVSPILQFKVSDFFIGWKSAVIDHLNRASGLQSVCPVSSEEFGVSVPSAVSM